MQIPIPADQRKYLRIIIRDIGQMARMDLIRLKYDKSFDQIVAAEQTKIRANYTEVVNMAKKLANQLSDSSTVSNLKRTEISLLNDAAREGIKRVDELPEDKLTDELKLMREALRGVNL